MKALPTLRLKGKRPIQWILILALLISILVIHYILLSSRIDQLRASERLLNIANRQMMLMQRSGAIFLLLLKTSYADERKMLHEKLIKLNSVSGQNLEELYAILEKGPANAMYAIPSYTRQLVDKYHQDLDKFTSVPTERLPFFISNPSVASIWHALESDQLTHFFNDWLDVNSHRNDQLVSGFYRELLYMLIFDISLLIMMVMSLAYLKIHKRIEHTLRLSNQRLEEQKQTREAALLKAEKDVQEARHLTDMGTVTAIVAHELRNPLAAIALAAVNIRRRSKDPVLEESLNHIEKNISESDQIINNLLLYSRLKAPVFERLNLNHVIEECIDLVAHRCGARKNVKITRELQATEAITLEADVIQIKEVLNNVLNNACDAVPESNGEIEVKTALKVDTVEICVKDNGCGIEKDLLERILEPFFTTKKKGTGLGLSICSQIVSLHGGTIHIDSQPGEGTRVHIILPRSR